MTTPDNYHDKYNDLVNRLTAPDQDEHTRKIAREETDKRFMFWIAIGLLWLATEKYGWAGTASILGLGIIWAIFIAWRSDRNPKHERHLVPLKAEYIVRLEIIREAAASGKCVWVLEEKKYERDKRKIVPVADDQWDSFWERAYKTALELENLSPRERQRRFLAASKAASEPLAQGSEIAKRSDAEFIYWAADALHELRALDHR